MAQRFRHTHCRAVAAGRLRLPNPDAVTPRASPPFLGRSYPMAMVVSELSVALPHSGGYIVWVNTAFGPLASLLNGMSNMLCNVLDCALYPLLLTDYLQRTVLPLLPTP
eukprot:5498332-Prymnesium_polylepis.1